MLIGHVSNQRAIRKEGNVHGRESEQGVHDVCISGTDLKDPTWVISMQGNKGPTTHNTGHIRRDLAGPQSEAVGIDGVHLIADRSNMEDQAKILERVILGSGSGVDPEAGKGEDSRPLPLFDGRLDLRRPHQVRLIRSSRPLIRERDVVVRASYLMLGTVAATHQHLVIALPEPQVQMYTYH